MPPSKPHNRRQRKVAFKHELQEAGLWKAFVEERERLKSGGVSGAAAWDRLMPAFKRLLANPVAASQVTGSSQDPY